ncbi:hypothetical protein [Tetragenococcus solitarius]|uniref:Uncharacterized protein n=1 Tax=Tetragenococcus solitarius TaxID=71453 RepID=A0ABP6KNZ5_9ENTE|nr:hypothetical protein [Tetragenococcus solitarius]
MKKTQKEKKKLLEETKENQFLDYVRRQIKNVLENDPDMDDSLMFFSVMKVVPEYLSSGKWSKKTLDFTRKYYYPPNKIEKLHQISEFSEPYKKYCELVHNYYLLTQEEGKKIFQKMLDWFPAKKEKNTIASWSDSFVVSLFHRVELQDSVYFEDIRTKERYKATLLDEIFIHQIETLYSPFLALLVPSDKGYITDTILECENFDLIDPTKTKDLSKKEWEEYVFHWYRTNLLKSVTSENPSLEEENVEFYSAGRLMDETDFDFANRLIEQDENLYEFPYLGQLTQLLIKVIRNFPHLFLAKVNALPLLDAMKILFTDLDMDLTAEYNYTNHQGHLWLILIIENLPEEVAAIQNYQVEPEYWEVEF